MKSTITVLFLVLILLLSTIAYGGVALWAQTLIGLMCFVYAGLYHTFLRHRKDFSPSIEGRRYYLFFAGWIGLITLVYGVMSIIQGTLNQLVLISTTLFLWSAWATLMATTRNMASRTGALTLLITGIAILGTIQALIGIIGLYAPLGVYTKFVSGFRAAGTFSSGNSMGGLLALTLPPTLAMAHLAMLRASQHIQQRGMQILHDANREDYCVLFAILWLLAALVQSVALLLSGSRGAIAATAFTFVCLCIWFIKKRHQHRERLPAAAAILTLLLVLAIGVGGTYAWTFQRLKQLETVQETALPRTAIWTSALKLVIHRPFGVGPGCFSEAFVPYQPEGYGNNRVYHAHNDYLELMVETGLPGLLLLLIGFAATLTAVTRRLLPTSEGTSVWMRRGALLSVAAGLIHAAVDFNVTSRPGVAAMFFCLLGVACSRRPCASARHDRPARGTDRTTPLLKAAMITICGLLTINQLRLGTAMTFMEQGFTAISGDASLYFWLPIPRLDREQALARLRRAARLAPDSAEVQLRLARALVIAGNQTITEAIANAQADMPDVPPAMIAQQMHIMMRVDQRRWLEEAKTAIDKARLRAPRNGDVLSQSARICATLAGLMPSSDETVAMVKQSLQHLAAARDIGVNDVTILHTLLAALPRLAEAMKAINDDSVKPEIEQLARWIGLHLLQLGESRLQAILDAWSRVDLDPFAILGETGELPADAAVQLYHFYRRAHNAEASIRSLDTLEQAITRKALSSARFRGTETKAELLENYQFLLIRERARWQLRQHQFDDYRQSEPLRLNVLQRDIARKLEQDLPNDGVALRFRYLNLKSLFDTRGLDENHTRELISLMEQHGESDAAIANVQTLLQPMPQPEPTNDAMPDHVLSQKLLGGRVVFMGFSIRDDTIHTYWRFHSRVPSDLQVLFLLRDKQFAHVTSAAFRFTHEFGRAFAVGSPPIGKVFHAETRFPVTAALSEHLAIGVRRLSTRQYLPSIEGLPRCEIYNWKRLRRTPEANPSLNKAVD